MSMPTKIRVAVTWLLLVLAHGRAFTRPSVVQVQGLLLGRQARKDSPSALALALVSPKASRTAHSSTRLRPRDPLVFMQQQQHQPSSSSVPPSWVYRLNASTKWVVTGVATWGIWTRITSYHGPFIVVGAIASVYLTDVLKRIANHDRPVGSPLKDPGMPSSHSLVSFFMVSAWISTGWWLLTASSSSAAAAAASSTTAVTKTVSTLFWKELVLVMGASMVAWLRVVTGYHSLDQITVGAVLGCLLGLAWAKLGIVFFQSFPNTCLGVSWGIYIMASAFFMIKNMKAWLFHEKHV
jgi:membrane-associated phospholipid phosphatase